MKLIAIDRDDKSVYQVIVNQHDLATLLQEEFPDTYGEETESYILKNVMDMEPEDVDGVIIGLLHNQSQPGIDYKINLLGEIEDIA